MTLLETTIQLALFIGIVNVSKGLCATQNSAVSAGTLNFTIVFCLLPYHRPPLRIQHISPMTSDAPFVFNGQSNQASSRYHVRQTDNVVAVRFTLAADFDYGGFYKLTARGREVSTVAVDVLGRPVCLRQGALGVVNCTVLFSGYMKPKLWCRDDVMCQDPAVHKLNETVNLATCRCPLGDESGACLVKFDESSVNFSEVLGASNGLRVGENVPDFLDYCETSIRSLSRKSSTQTVHDVPRPSASSVTAADYLVIVFVAGFLLVLLTAYCYLCVIKPCQRYEANG